MRSISKDCASLVRPPAEVSRRLISLTISPALYLLLGRSADCRTEPAVAPSYWLRSVEAELHHRFVNVEVVGQTPRARAAVSIQRGQIGPSRVRSWSPICWRTSEARKERRGRSVPPWRPPTPEVSREAQAVTGRGEEGRELATADDYCGAQSLLEDRSRSGSTGSRSYAVARASGRAVVRALPSRASRVVPTAFTVGV